MESKELRIFLHDLANALNAAKINTYLLGKLHGEALDRETFAGLNSALHDGEKLAGDFHRRVHAEQDAAAAAARHEKAASA